MFILTERLLHACTKEQRLRKTQQSGGNIPRSTTLAYFCNYATLAKINVTMAIFLDIFEILTTVISCNNFTQLLLCFILLSFGLLYLSCC